MQQPLQPTQHVLQARTTRSDSVANILLSLSRPQSPCVEKAEVNCGLEEPTNPSDAKLNGGGKRSRASPERAPRSNKKSKSEWAVEESKRFDSSIIIDELALQQADDIVAELERVYKAGCNDKTKKTQCHACKKTFSAARFEDLKRHYFRFHCKVAPYQCKHCDKTFSDRNYCELHLRRYCEQHKIDTNSSPSECTSSPCTSPLSDVEAHSDRNSSINSENSRSISLPTLFEPKEVAVEDASIQADFLRHLSG